MIETSEGFVVDAAGCYVECHRFQEAARVQTEKYELLGTIEYFKKQQNGPMATMERKHRLMKGAWEEFQNRFFKEFLNLEEKLTEVASELFEANSEMRKLTV